MKTIHCGFIIQALLLFELSLGNARADGGVVQFRGAQGPFVVTVFTTPAPIQDNTTDVSLLVQRKDSHDATLDATVDLLFTSPPLLFGRPVGQLCGLPGVALLGQNPGQGASHTSVRATRAQASSKLLYAAPIRFGMPGNWKLDAIVSRGTDSARVSCVIAVGPANGRLIGLLPYLALPPVVAILFAMNQALRRGSRVRCMDTIGTKGNEQ